MKQYKSYMTIYGILKGKRKASHIEIDLTGLDLLNHQCPIYEHIKQERKKFKSITKEIVRQYGYRESNEMIFRDLYPTNEYIFGEF